MERELEDFDNLDAVDDSEAYYTDEELADLEDAIADIEEEEYYEDEVDEEDEDEEEDDNPFAAYDPDEWN